HVSGVLSIVSAGLFISWRAPDVFSYQTRIRHRAVWDTIVFLLNGFVFILIGLQLRSILADLGQYSLKQLILYGFDHKCSHDSSENFMGFRSSFLTCW